MNIQYEKYEATKYQTLWKMVEINAERYPDKTAFMFYEKGNTVEKSFLDFKRDVCAAAKYLGLEKEKKTVAVIGANSYTYIAAWFAVPSAGSVIVPIDWQRKQSDLSDLIADSKSEIVLYGEEVSDCVEEYEKTFENRTKFISFKEFADALEKTKLESSCDGLAKIASENDVAAILYTSGTTSNSKGVMLSHRNFCADAYGSCCQIFLNRKTLHVLPWHHVYGMIGLLCTFSCGTVNFINSSQKRFVEELHQFQPRLMIIVPLYVESLYKIIMLTLKKKQMLDDFNQRLEMCRRAGIQDRETLRETFKDVRSIISSELETLICGGAALDVKYIRFFREIGIDVRDGYGITECAAVITVNRDRFFKEGSVGIPIPVCEVKILNSDYGVGEVAVKGENVMLGYYNNDAENQKAFVNGWYRTGDIGYFDEDGFLFLKGRIKNLIISPNGENVCPEELELLIGEIPEVKEVVVYLKNERYIAAQIFPDMDYIQDSKNDDFETVIKKKVAELNQMLPAYKVVEEVIFRDTEFEKNTSKKIMRYKI